MKDEYYFWTEGLTVGYRGIPLVKNVELQLKKGEILTLIGPNGAGKTTILKSIIRQLSPIAGTVYLDGRQTAQMTGKELSRCLSVVLTERVRPELMTCRDVVATGRYPYTGRFGVLGEQDHRAVEEAMELVQIRELSDRDFAKISVGQRQRVMLARAVCQEPDILVLDEPTSFLDIKYKLEFLSVLQQLKRSGKLTVIMSLHELDLAERISDRIACIRKDRIDRFGTPEEIFVPGYIPQLYDMTSGSYDERTGNIELEPAKGRPQIFVLAGNGTGTCIYRRLQREGIPFATGILWENDLDIPAARALAAEVITEKAFCSLKEETLERAGKRMDDCSRVICTLDPETLGDFGKGQKELYLRAEAQGKLTSLF